jgi:hypothetical protein
MVTARKEVEITLHSIRILETASGLDSETTHLLSADLLWPRVGVAHKSSSQTCELKKGVADFETVNWGRRILFKDSVEGRFALALTLTEELDDEELEQFFRFCAGAFLSVAAGLVESAARPVGKVAAAPLDYVAKNVGKYPGPKLLVEGLAELDSADFPERGGERLLTLRMTAARRLTGKHRLKKGEPNGEITLAVRTL